MLQLPFLFHQSPGDLVLGRLWKLPISPLVRVSTSVRAAHLYVIGMSGKGKSKLFAEPDKTGLACDTWVPNQVVFAVSLDIAYTLIMVYLELFFCAWSNPRERTLHIRPLQDPDAVFVPTPDSLHEEHVAAALED